MGEFGDWELRFSYRLPRNLQLSYTINEQRQNAVLFEESSDSGKMPGKMTGARLEVSKQSEKPQAKPYSGGNCGGRGPQLIRRTPPLNTALASIPSLQSTKEGLQSDLPDPRRL